MREAGYKVLQARAAGAQVSAVVREGSACSRRHHRAWRRCPPCRLPLVRLSRGLPAIFRKMVEGLPPVLYTTKRGHTGGGRRGRRSHD